MPDTAPLPARLSWLWTAWAVEVDNRVESAVGARVRRLFRISLAMWSNALRVIDGPTSVAELHARARAGSNLGGLERWGWIVIGAPGERRSGFGTGRGIRPDTVLRPTRAGAHARRVWPEVVAEVEDGWQVRFGSDAVAALRTALTARERSMPWSPPEVHSSDGFRTAVLDGTSPEEEPMPLIAALGQALTSGTLDFEQRRTSSVPICANLLRVLADGPVSVRDLPSRSGVSKEAITMAVGFARRTGVIAPPTGSTVELTDSGRRRLSAYRRWAQNRTDPALAAAVDALLSQRDALAAGLVPLPGGWRGEPPYAAHTERAIADPLDALPWQPMVLHRGGWPDGS